MTDLNWSVSQILSDEWTMEDLTILRAYEWDRINFATAEKREKLARIMKIDLAELEQLRRDTFRSVQDNLHQLRQRETAQNAVSVEHHGDHRSPGAQTYPAVQLKAEESVSFGF